MNEVTHYCGSETYELEPDRYLPEAGEFRTVAPCGCVVYSSGECEHQ